jgi:hypothetical protein
MNIKHVIVTALLWTCQFCGKISVGGHCVHCGAAQPQAQVSQREGMTIEQV